MQLDPTSAIEAFLMSVVSLLANQGS